MCETLTEIRNLEPKRKLRTRKSRVWMIYDDFDKLLAWALIIPMDGRGYEAQFYTRKTERGKGYGSILMQKVLEIDRKPYVFPHDKRSGDFFKKHKKSIRYDKYDQRWLE